MDDKYMKNSKGHLVPVELVKPIDRTRDELVKDIVAKATGLAKQLADFKAAAMGDIKAFIDLSLREYDVSYGGTKGNVTLNSYDGEYRVLLAIADYIQFDERLQAAKALIDECLNAWTEGARPEVRVIIDSAFEVDKQGKISTGKVLGLRRLGITDAKWMTAMEAIANSITIINSKEYIRIYRRDADGEYKLLDLSVAA